MNPGAYLNEDDLKQVRENISNLDFVAQAWSRTRAAADAAQNHQPRPPTNVNFSSRQDSLNRLYMPGRISGHAARNSALVYAINGSESAGANAKRIIMAWVREYPAAGSRPPHYVDEPVGFVIKGLMAYSLTEELFTKGERDQVAAWCGVLKERAKRQTVQAGDKPGSDGSSGPWGNNVAWSRLMACWCAAVQEDDSIWPWNWNGPDVNKAYGWQALLNGMMTAQGELVDESRSIHYALYTLHPYGVLADLHEHVRPTGVSAQRLWFSTSTNKSLLLAAERLAPYLNGTRTAPQALDVPEYRASYELFANAYPESQAVRSALRTRGTNYDAHLVAYGGLLGARRDVVEPPPPPPPVDLAKQVAELIAKTKELLKRVDALEAQEKEGETYGS